MGGHGGLGREPVPEAIVAVAEDLEIGLGAEDGGEGEAGEAELVTDGAGLGLVGIAHGEGAGGEDLTKDLGGVVTG